MVNLVTRGDTVHLKNWNWRNHNYHPPKGIDVALKHIPNSSNEAYMTLYGSEKDNIYKNNINEELARLSRNILSDRVRTLRTRPTYKVINSKKERIQ